jgi:hypothetical protein
MANPAWVKGKSGNPLGRAVETSTKPFGEALRMEIAAAGADHKALRAIARNLITLAQKPDATGLSAAMAVADRLDGKPTQESIVNVKRDSTDWNISDLVTAIREHRADRERVARESGRAGEPDSVH